MNDWRNFTEDWIDNLGDSSSLEILWRKASVQSGFQKCKYPIFQGASSATKSLNGLDNEANSERKPEKIELPFPLEALTNEE